MRLWVMRTLWGCAQKGVITRKFGRIIKLKVPSLGGLDHNDNCQHPDHRNRILSSLQHRLAFCEPYTRLIYTKTVHNHRITWTKNWWHSRSTCTRNALVIQGFQLLNQLMQRGSFHFEIFRVFVTYFLSDRNSKIRRHEKFSGSNQCFLV